MTILYLSTLGESVTYLPQPILNYGECVVGVLDITGKIDRKPATLLKPLYLCCDFVDHSTLHNFKIPILRQFATNKQGYVNSSVGHVIWLKMTRSVLSKARLYICNEDGEKVSFTGRGIYCTLEIN